MEVGKEMALALLESDESTASLSDFSTDKDSFMELPQLSPPMTTLNPRSTSFNPIFRRNPCRLEPFRPPAPPAVPTVDVCVPPAPFVRGSHYRCVALDCESKKAICCCACLLLGLVFLTILLVHVSVVGVGPGGQRSVVARVSIVDYFGRCLLDTFVKVEEKVTDYRHHITGITAGDLTSKKAMSFGKCRATVIKLIRNKILVGHGLDNDFAALGIYHPWYVWTAASLLLNRGAD